MNRISPRDTRKWRALRDELVRNSDPNEMLDILLALDKLMVEFSMRVYNLPQRDRHLMREHNRRLHNVVRARLPRLLEPPRTKS